MKNIIDRVLGTARSSLPTAIVDGKEVELLLDEYGRIRVIDDSSSAADVSISTVYNVTLTSADTEYSQALTANTREFRFRCRTLYDVRYAFVSGKVATPTSPWLTLPAGSDYWSDNLNFTGTLYLASSQAGVIIEVEEWIV